MGDDAREIRQLLVSAQGRLQRAETYDPGAQTELTCEDAQQTVEHALKALIEAKRGTYKPIHSIEYLLETLQELGEEIPDEVWATQDLTDYSGASRYKVITGEEDAPSRESASDAAKAARTTLSWCTERIRELRPELKLPRQIGQHAAPPATPPGPARGSAKAQTRPPGTPKR